MMPLPDAGRRVQLRAVEGRFLPTSPGARVQAPSGCLVEATRCVHLEIESKKKETESRPPVKAAGMSVFLSFSNGPYFDSAVAPLMASEALLAASCSDLDDRWA